MREAAAAPPDAGEPLAVAVAAARGSPALLAALRALYVRADAEAERLGAPCRACGDCCDFHRAGHRLYVSTGELALLLAAPAAAGAAPGRCPYQRDRLCTARDRRALGCRLFFCEQRVAAASHAAYEALHAEIRRLHEGHGVVYQYVDLPAGIAACRQAAAAGDAGGAGARRV